MAATVAQLVQEIIDRIVTLPQFDVGFSIYDMDDAEEIAKYGTLPIVMVSYEGGEPRENKVDSKGRGSHSALLYTCRFSVTLAMEYASAVNSVDTKINATDLLDAIRPTMLGYKGVNSRPWRFGSEFPIPGDLEGVIFYGQLWETDIPIIGTFQQT